MFIGDSETNIHPVISVCDDGAIVVWRYCAEIDENNEMASYDELAEWLGDHPCAQWTEGGKK